MRLTWRDGVATVFAIAVGLVALAVVQGWDWPFLGSYRTGMVALWVLATPMCSVGGHSFWNGEEFKRPSLIAKDPFLVVAIAVAIASLVALIVGLITGTRGPFVTVAVLMGVLWLVTTVRHATQGIRGTHFGARARAA